MSEKEIIITREMVKAITNETINRLALYSMISIMSIALSGAVWIGTIQTDVKSLLEAMPESRNSAKQQIQVSAKLDFIIETLKEVKSDIKDNRNAIQIKNSAIKNK